MAQPPRLSLLKRHHYGRGAGLGLLLLACSACATEPVPATVASPGMPNAELALQRAIAQVDTDVGHLGMLRPEQYASTAGIVPAELQKPMTLQWTGPLDGAVRKVGKAVGYNVSVQSVPNARPLPVAVNQYGQAVELLRSLGEQAGATATVSVDPLHHQITVIHNG
jgi:defect in organelle trafficking protein DotD